MPGAAQAKQGRGCNGNARVRVTEIRNFCLVGNDGIRQLTDSGRHEN